MFSVSNRRGKKKESRRRRKSARLRIETLIDVGTENKSRMQTAPEKKLRRPDICLLIKSVLCEKRHVTQIVWAYMLASWCERKRHRRVVNTFFFFAICKFTFDSIRIRDDAIKAIIARTSKSQINKRRSLAVEAGAHLSKFVYNFISIFRYIWNQDVTPDFVKLRSFRK